MRELHRDRLHRGGFAGIEETRMVHDKRIGGDGMTWDGLGKFVYLADARYLPFGESRMHSHQHINVITVMLEGNLHHEGSLEHGQPLTANQVQVQRSGGEGFSHNEVNPDEFRCRLLQVWTLPEHSRGPADYQVYDIELGKITQIYGDSTEGNTASSATKIYVARLTKEQTWQLPYEFLCYVVNGTIEYQGKTYPDGSLIRGSGSELLVTSEDVHLTVITDS
ncbi:pirin family protein [Vibrio fluminensis]|uniref:pirin family protein n=1 Tax=Vibrio fluminensis TaxID=2783614 RepID=UPI0018883806|nr:pirin family protein [Vibrio fluminensis]